MSTATEQNNDEAAKLRAELHALEDRLTAYQEWLGDKSSEQNDQNNPFAQSLQKLHDLGDPIRFFY